MEKTRAEIAGTPPENEVNEAMEISGQPKDHPKKNAKCTFVR